MEVEQPGDIPNEIEVNQEDLETIPDEKQSKSSSSCLKTIFNIFGSFLGLLIILIIYIAGGAYYFHVTESELENANHDAMIKDLNRLNDSANYIVDYLSDLHFSPLHTINDCTAMIDDECYQNFTDGYYEACGPTCKNTSSAFCICIRDYRKRFEADVRFPLLHVFWT